VRGGNDIVWVGRAANYAAKLCDLRTDGVRTWITNAVYDSLADEAKFAAGTNMWKSYQWSQNNNQPIYGSTCTWAVS
jgi:class 3 adenylate cyclase